MELLKTNKYKKTIQNIENLKLKDIVTAFVYNDKIEDLLNKLNQRGFDENTLVVLSHKDAKKIIDINNHGMSFMTRISRILESFVGGGPSEFLRDIKKMKSNQFLLLVDIDSEAEKDKVFSVLRAGGAKRVKYFTSFYVEHGTLESDHRQMATAI